MRGRDLDIVALALDAMDEAIGIFDTDDRLVISNRRYVDLRSAIGGDVVPGVCWRDLVRASVEAGAISEAIGCEEEWLKRRRRARGAYSVVREVPDGGLFRVNERRMANGGVVVVWTDVSEVLQPRTRLHSERQVLYRLWASKGLSVRARTALSLAGCRSNADIIRYGRNYFAQAENCGPVTLREIENLIGGWPEDGVSLQQNADYLDNLVTRILPRRA